MSLSLYYLFKETTVLSNNVQLLCQATLTTYCGYDSISAVTWCAGNQTTFNPISFSKHKQLISYAVTTPVANTLASTVITSANQNLLNATLWSNGFFSKETSLASVVDVENYWRDKTFYYVFISLYIVFWMLFCGGVYAWARTITDDKGKKKRVELGRGENVLMTIHILLFIATAAIIGVYALTMLNDTTYIESKGYFALLEHVAVVHIVVFEIFTIIFW